MAISRHAGSHSTPMFRRKWALLASSALVAAAVAIPSAAMAAPVSALIYDYNLVPGIAQNLAAQEAAAGNTATINTSPGTSVALSGYGQVWDLGANAALTSAQVSYYTNYLQNGGTLFVMGENSGYGAARNATISSFLTGLGGGSVNVSTTTNSAGSQTVASQFLTANTDANVTFAAVGQFASVGSGTCITSDCGAAAWGVGTLANAPKGAVISVLDVNFLQTTYLQTDFIDNLIAYLNQQQKISKGKADITNTTGSDLASQIGSTLNPRFDGGTLTADQNLSTNFTVTGNGGTIDTAGGTHTFSGIFSNNSGNSSGSIVIANSGTGGGLILTGANTFQGGFTIDPGATLQIGSGSALGPGILNLLGTTTTPSYLFITGTTIIPNAITVTGDPVFNIASGTTTTISGTISDGASPGDVVKQGAGTLVLNGVNSYSGPTTVSDGTLVVGDSSHSGAVINSRSGGVTVGKSGTLEGHGTIIGSVSNSAGGTVRPGGSIGTLTVGSYTQGAGSTLAIEVSPTAASKLVVTGAASLNGTLDATFNPGTYTASIYPIVTGNPISGTFSQFTQTGAPVDAVYGLYYNGTSSVDLLVAPTATTAAFGNVSTAAIDDAHWVNRMLMGRSHTESASACLTGQSGSGKSSAMSAGCSRYSSWLQPYGRLARTASSGTRAGFNSEVGGLLGGFDMRMGSGLIGVMAGYAHDQVDMNAGISSASMNSYQVGLYSEVALNKFLVDGAVFYFGTHTNLTRDTLGAGLARSHPGGHGIGAAWQVRYDPGSVLTPVLQFNFANFHRNATTETGAGLLDMYVGSKNSSSLRAELGVEVHRVYEVGDTTISPNLLIAVEQSLMAPNVSGMARLASLAGTNFRILSPTPRRAAALVGLGATVHCQDNLELFGNLKARASANQLAGTLFVGLRYRL